jgi:hypothetical protein
MSRSLPGVDVSGVGDGHLAFRVKQKTFAYYLHDHHGDGRIALCCKAPPGEQGRLVEADPDRFFVPPYLGPKGWVACRLDLRSVDWEEVQNLVFAAYFLTAPVSLRVLTEPRKAAGRKRRSKRGSA